MSIGGKSRRKLAERISGKNAAVSRYPGGEYSISARIKLANCKVIFYNKNNMCLGSVNGTEEEQMPSQEVESVGGFSLKTRMSRTSRKGNRGDQIALIRIRDWVAKVIRRSYCGFITK